MANRATARSRGKEGARPPLFHRSLCPVCEGPVTAGQTWKFDRQGRKVHYYCAKENPRPYEGVSSYGPAKVTPASAYSTRMPCHDCIRGGVRKPAEFCVSRLALDEKGNQVGISRVFYCGEHLPREENPYDQGEATHDSWVIQIFGVGYLMPLGVGGEAARRGKAEFTDDVRKAVVVPLETARAWIGPQSPWWGRGAAVRLYDALKAQKRGNPAGPTYSQAMAMARKAGASIGDTSGFEPWLVKTKLAGRGPQVLAHLKREFWAGVEGVQGRTETASFTYKGATINKVGQGYRVSTDPESEFDSLPDAKRFVDAQKNPSVSSIRGQYLKLIERYAYAYESKKLSRMNAAHEALEQFETKYNLDPNSRADAISFLKRTRSVNLSLMHALDSINDFYRGNPRVENPSTPWWKRRTA